MDQALPTKKTLAAAAALELAVLFGLLFFCLVFFNQLASDSLFERSLKDSGHTVTFFVAVTILLRLVTLVFPNTRVGLILILCGGFGFATGIFIEFAQPFFGRQSSFLDIWYNLLGIVSACLIFLARCSAFSRTKTIVCCLAACGAFSISMILPLYYHHIERQQDALFPAILNFERAWQQELFIPLKGTHLSWVDAPKEWEGNASKVARLDFHSGRYPGLHAQYLRGDWQPYRNLYLEIFSKSKTKQTVEIRVHDSTHNSQYRDRYNRSFVINYGVNKLLISLAKIENAPKDRTMDLSRIEGIVIFAESPDEPFSLYLDNIKLL